MSPNVLFIVEAFYNYNYIFLLDKKCTEYNVRGGVLQRNLFADCDSCPGFYFSNETFKCKFRYFKQDSEFIILCCVNKALAMFFIYIDSIYMYR